MMSRKAVNRQDEMTRFIEERKQVSIEDLTGRYHVSEATIRRDLGELDASGKISRVFGGARSLALPDLGPPDWTDNVVSTPEMEHIGRHTAAMIGVGQTVYIGSGTTAMHVARFLAERTNLKVITNSLPVINLMQRNTGITLMSLGGLLSHSEQSFIGSAAELSIQEFRADRAIVGARAIDVDHGITNDYIAESKIDRLIFRMAKEIIVVADSSKFDRVAPTFVAPLSAVGTIVTDGGITSSLAEAIRQHGIELVIAD